MLVGMSASLSSLPVEIIYCVAEHLDDECQVNALSQLNQRFYGLLNEYTYKANFRNNNGTPDSIVRAAAHGLIRTVAKAIAAGAGPKHRQLALAAAATHGHDAVISLLHTHGVKVTFFFEQLENGIYNIVDADSPFNDRPVFLNKVKTPLAAAAEYGHRSAVRLLLGYGADIEQGSLDGRSALSLAAASGHLSVVETLAGAGAAIDAKDSRDFTPLYRAVKAGHREIVSFLIEHGADVNSRARGDFPLTAAAASGHLQILQCLLHHGAQLDMKALYATGSFVKPGILEVLAHHFNLPQAAKTVKEQTIFAMAAAGSGCFDLLEETINNGWDVSSPPILGYEEYNGIDWVLWTPLAWAARHGHLDIVRLLLSRGADPNGRRGVTAFDDEHACPLHYAVQHGQEEVVSLLLEHDAVAYVRGDEYEVNNVLFNAVQYPAIFKRLMKNKSITDAFSDYMLQFVAEEAVIEGQGCEVQLLIDHGLDFASTDDYSLGLTQLLGQSNESVLEVFLRNGYIPEPGSEAEQHAVRAAIRHGGLPLLDLVVKRGFNLRSEKWFFYLVNQASNASGAILDFFLRQGIHIDCLNHMGETPLLALTRTQPFDSQSYLPFLLDRGANPCFQSPAGDCPLVAAVTIHHPTIEWVKLLLDGIKKQGIPYKIFEPQMKQAIDVLEKNGEHNDVLKVLRRFYWRATYPV